MDPRDIKEMPAGLVGLRVELTDDSSGPNLSV